MKRALQIILGVSLAGLGFSGYLSYVELVAAGGEPTCTPVGQPGTVLGYPPCIYGLAMYLVIAVVASFGLSRSTVAGGAGRKRRLAASAP